MNIPSLMLTSPTPQGDACANALSAGFRRWKARQRDTNSLTGVVEGVSALYGEKRDLILMDNNVVASANFRKIIAEIVDLGFERGAKLKRGRYEVQRRVDFNQGVDARILCKDPMYLQQLAKIALKPLRIAFDHLELRSPTHRPFGIRQMQV